MNAHIEDKSVTRRELKRILYQRPLIIPAVLCLITCLVTYHTESVFPAVITACFMLIFGVAFCRDNMHILLCYFITALLAVFAGLSISARLASFSGFTGYSIYRAEVFDIKYRADGTAVLECSLECGAHAAVYVPSSEGIGTGDVIRLTGKLSEPERPGNPGEFDYAEYLRRKGISYVMWPEEIRVISKGTALETLPGIVSYQIYLLRLYFLNTFSAGDADIKAVASAVFTGDTSLLDDDLTRSFRLTNCAHLLAVSGTHFAGFLLVLPLILKTLHTGRKKAVFVYASAALAIGMFTGWSDSVIRACVMSTCSFASRDGPSAMGLAALIMITADPFSPLGSGFQLSFAAAGVLLIFLPPVKDKLMRAGLSKTVSDLLAPALTVTAAMLPFCSVTGIRVHPAIIVIQITSSVILQTACMFLIPGFALGINAPAVFCLRVLISLARTGSEIVSSAGIPVTKADGPVIAFLALAGLCLLPSCFVKKHLVMPLCIMLSVCIGFRTAEILTRPKVQVIFADVGQGDCCLIITDDKTCLIDAGVYDEGAKTVRNMLDYYGIASVDYAFMSHWDADHAGGIAALYAGGRINTVYTAFTGEDDDVKDFLDAVPFREGEEDMFLSACIKVPCGQVFVLGEGVELKVIAPKQAAGGGNADSLVMVLESGGKTVLFTGDIGTETEQELIQEGVLSDCDILKVAHHGSKYSTSEDFLEATTPEIAVISVGKNNFYGHPTEECLVRLENCGCEIYRTDTDGAVILGIG